MPSTNFIDHVRLFCRSGSGGAGSSHFRREKHVPKGGPDGGDGGRGGDVILKGNSQLWTLLHLRYTKHIHAGNGQPGSGSHSSGADGETQIIEVPLGTVAKNAETDTELFEITEHGQEVVLLKGGAGGLGNAHFKSATRQSPQYAQPGIKGLEGWFVLELKLLADVGLVGLPNAGKSTLLSVVSAAKPKIADYPFTTLTPNVGVVSYYDQQSFVMADIPGIIEGASEGKGLGLRFLRHIERNALLLFMVPADSDNIVAEYNLLEKELLAHNPELQYKQKLLAITKCDLLDQELTNEIKVLLPTNVPHCFISSVSGLGIAQLKDKIWQMLN